MKRHYHLKSRFMNIMVWLVRAREPIIVFTPWSCRTRLVPFFIRQLQAMEQSSQNLSFHNVHSLVPLFSGCNFSFYIATNCLAKILFQFSNCSLCQSSISSIHWFSVLQFHWGFLKFIECFHEPLLNMSNAIQFHYLVTACSSSQVILFPLLKTFWSFPGNTLLVTVLQIFIVVTSVSGFINTPYGIIYFRVPIRNHSLVPDKVLLTSSPHPFNTFHLRTWAGAFIRAFTMMGLVSLFKLVFSQTWLLLWAHTTGFWNNFKVQHCQLQQK